MTKRMKRLNSLLREVITEVIRSEVSNPKVSELATVSEVDISKDLQYAKVYISVIGTDQERKNTIHALQSASGFISVSSSKKVVMRTFPSLTFHLDTGVEKYLKIDSLLQKIHREQETRKSHE